jgi:hypothetical protein
MTDTTSERRTLQDITVSRGPYAHLYDHSPLTPTPEGAQTHAYIALMVHSLDSLLPQYVGEPHVTLSPALIRHHRENVLQFTLTPDSGGQDEDVLRATAQYVRTLCEVEQIPFAVISILTNSTRQESYLFSWHAIMPSSLALALLQHQIKKQT